jgi:tRNA pseudouridine32 synthase/23S rRNA pseudouridine746 synthase
MSIDPRYESARGFEPAATLQPPRIPMEPKRWDIIIGEHDPATACDTLARHTGLSKTRLKLAMTRGAVWLQRPKSKMRRVRRVTTAVRPGDRWTVYYDPAILDLDPPQARCLKKNSYYSVWFKPPGLMTQGTRFGDHCALARQVEHHFQMKRKALIVHRLDREASGLVIVAHSHEAAARLSAMLRKGTIQKGYTVRVRGDLTRLPSPGRIVFDLDAKHAVTEYEAVAYDAAADQTLVRVRIRTGRRHQIRRHLAMMGYPVMGDPRYGENNKNQSGLQLVADAVAFDCPFGGGRVSIRLEPQGLNFP